MKLLRGLTPVNALAHGAVITIGNFDGVHRGHQSILALAKKESMLRDLPLVVVLFEPQPNEYFSKDKAPARLTTFREKWTLLSKLGVDYIYCLHFNKKMANFLPNTFARDILFRVLHARSIFIGPDFHFGQGRQGDGRLLKTIAEDYACTVNVCNDFCLNDTRVSSTSIRQALAQGDLVRASHDLDRSYAISGRVVKGQGLGRKWGIPTANIHLARLSPALTGIFFVRVMRSKEVNTFYYGVANLGTRPTVGGFLTVLEVHLFDFDGSLYHERLEVVFLCKLRTEQTFSSIEALIAQIHLDISQAKAMLPHFAV